MLNLQNGSITVGYEGLEFGIYLPQTSEELTSSRVMLSGEDKTTDGCYLGDSFSTGKVNVGKWFCPGSGKGLITLRRCYTLRNKCFGSIVDLLGRTELSLCDTSIKRLLGFACQALCPRSEGSCDFCVG